MKKYIPVVISIVLLCCGVSYALWWSNPVYVEVTADIRAGKSTTIEVNIPAGAKLLVTELFVDAALAPGETWDARYIGGASQQIVRNALGEKGTRAAAFYNEYKADPITADETDIIISRSGGGKFSGQGRIRAIIHFQALD